MTAPDQNPDKTSEIDVVELHASQGEPVNVWVIVAATACLFIGGMFFLFHSGGFATDVYDPNAPIWSDDEAALAASADPRILGRRVFSQNCAICHQPDGLGVASLYPPLAGSEWVLAQDWHGDNHIVRIVLHGFTGSITVKGRAFNSEMAPWAPVLTNKEIAAVLTYVRSEWGNHAPPISEEFVAAIREQTKDRNDRWTLRELQALPGESSPLPVPSVPAALPASSPAQ